MTIYRTNEWNGSGKSNYYWNEYRREGDTIFKYKCHQQKTFDGKENTWDKEEKLEASWNINDPDLPDWLHKYI